MRPKPILNKWQFVLSVSEDFRTLRNGWKVADVGIFKLKRIDRDGYAPKRSDYSGFYFRFQFWLPVDRY